MITKISQMSVLNATKAYCILAEAMEGCGTGIQELRLMETPPICSCCIWDWWLVSKEGATGKLYMKLSLLQPRNFSGYFCSYFIGQNWSYEEYCKEDFKRVGGRGHKKSSRRVNMIKVSYILYGNITMKSLILYKCAKNELLI
jgi:hypothetical protein